ncbi:MAG: hypothetical protein NTY10_06960 [Candidatus Omnitrophica bacterium]|nr:hypothetical protein [Candidatus Omnitrophota bacterium]
METDKIPTVLKVEGVGVNFLTLDQVDIIMGFDNFLYVVLKSGPGKERKTLLTGEFLRRSVFRLPARISMFRCGISIPVGKSGK